MVTYFVGVVIAAIIAGIYCEWHNVDTASIAPRIFVRSLFWPLFIVNAVIWATGMFLMVIYGHCIATAAKERFRRK